jgi:hypothetical protein
MNRDTAIGLLDRLHKAQNEFYAGGSGAALQQLLAPNIMWTVPGDNRIAGTYRGLEDVLGYFRRRRDLADHTFQIKRRDVLVGDGDRIAALTDGFARSATSTIAGPPWACITSSISTSQRAGSSRSTSTRLTPSGPSEPGPEAGRRREVPQVRRASARRPLPGPNPAV